MTDTLNEQRRDAIHALLQEARQQVGRRGVNREALGAVLDALKTLAARADYWSLEEFPCQDPVIRQTRYLLSEDTDRRYALYLVVWLPGRRIEPHNHTTWACIAGVAGQERNTLYVRRDDRSRPGHAMLEAQATLDVQPGTGLALMPDDIHQVEIVGEQPAMNLHLYGKALETLDRRVGFDLERQSYQPRGIGIPSVRWNDGGAAG